MSELKRIVGHVAMADYMGWASREVSAVMFSAANRRREAESSRPGDMPPADGYERRGANYLPWWHEDTVTDWAAGRPTAIAAARNRPDGLKVCSDCGTAKPLSDFSAYVDRRPGRSKEARPTPNCKACRTKAARQWNQDNPERHGAADAKWHKKTHRHYRARRYGLTETELDMMEAKQQGLCLICEEPAENGLFIDHCHATGAVRGLLCGQCNLGLGAFRDSPDLLTRAIMYLKERGNGITAGPDREDSGRVA